MASEGRAHMVRQSLLFSLINYSGIGIGILASLYLYPRNRALYGTFSYIQAGAELLMPLMGFGISQAVIKYFPAVKSDADKRNRLFTFSLSFVTLCSLLIGGGMLALRACFPAVSAYVKLEYAEYSVLVGISITLIDLFKRYLYNFRNITTQAVVDSFILRLSLPTLFILVLYFGVKPVFTYKAFSYFYLVVTFFVLLYTLRFTQTQLDLRFSAIKSLIGKPFFQYSVVTLASFIGSKLAFNIDRIMIPNLLSETANGTYTIALSLSRTMAVPATAVIAIASPLITDYLAAGKLNALEQVYQRTSLSLSLVGLSLYCAVFLGIGFLFQSLSTAKNLLLTVPLLLVLGVGFVFNMAAGVNAQIISFSRYYRFSLYLTLLLGGINVVLNLFFVSVLHSGVLGVAYATLLSLTLFNTAVIAFVYRKFKILPLTPNHIKILITGVATTALIYGLPDFERPLLNAFYKPALFLLIHLGVVYGMKWVEEFNELVDKLIGRLKDGVPS